ncbi:YkgJ family cysteine cluster protein [Konateibacter massiliensis]|uniref:YkgJ family cysteine cluster protein n=1 Tax=Konateibacter massiliensis TaxID=2002841 RepID=UPI000C1477AB|nr:YkgJ family cysteine cluster protein [Konateibacter massiliensis]
MKRNVSLEEISDGKLYGANDMVKADCNGCKGCSVCCHDMGGSIILDTLDVHRLRTYLKKSFEELLAEHVELQVVDGIILPNLKMSGEAQACTFLGSDERCTIHPSRPGICRLFPLGRYYENGSFRYFLQINECAKQNRTKIKVNKWLDIPDLKRYEEFVTKWHYFLNTAEDEIKQSQDETKIRNMNMLLLNLFYVKPYAENEDFYTQFYERLGEAEHLIFN